MLDLRKQKKKTASGAYFGAANNLFNLSFASCNIYSGAFLLFFFLKLQNSKSGCVGVYEDVHHISDGAVVRRGSKPQRMTYNPVYFEVLQ